MTESDDKEKEGVQAEMEALKATNIFLQEELAKRDAGMSLDAVAPLPAPTLHVFRPACLLDVTNDSFPVTAPTTSISAFG